jgi:hypothetical protein
LGIRRPLSSDTTEDDDDRTIVTSSSTGHDSKETRVRKKKAKRRVLMSAGILLCAFICYAVFYYFSDALPFQGSVGEIDMPGDSVKNDLDSMNSSLIAEIKADTSNTQMQTQQTSEQDTSDQPPINNTQPQTNQGNMSIANGRTGTAPSTDNTVVTTSKPELTAQERAKFENDYQSLISSAKSKTESGNISGAREDISKAQAIIEEYGIKTLYEVEKLLDICKEKEKEKEVQERLAKYTVYYGFGFGKWTVARDKKTRLFGAIDAEGNECIECVYKTVNQIPNGKPPEFQRMGEDALVDIYDEEGELKKSGVQRSN